MTGTTPAVTFSFTPANFVTNTYDLANGTYQIDYNTTVSTKEADTYTFSVQSSVASSPYLFTIAPGKEKVIDLVRF